MSADKSPAKKGQSSYAGLVFGDDEYHAEKKAVELVQQFAAGEGCRAAIEKIDGETGAVEKAPAVVRRCIEALSARGLFAPRKVVWLANADFFGQLPANESKKIAPAVEQLAGIISGLVCEDSAIVVSASAVSKKSPLLDVFKKKGEIFEFSLPAPWNRAKAADVFAAERLAAAGVRASREEVSELVGMTGVDYRRIEQEIQKISVFLHPCNALSAGDWRSVVSTSREAIVWDLSDAVGERDLAKALRLLHSLLFKQDREEPFVIVDLLARHIRYLAVLKDLAGRGFLSVNYQGFAQLRDMPREWREKLDAVFGATSKKHPAKMSSFPLGKQTRQAANFTAAEMDEALRLAGEARWRIMDQAVPEQIVIEKMLLKICRRRGI